MSGTNISLLTGIKNHILPTIPNEFQGHFLPNYEKEWINMLHRFIAIFGGTILMFMSWFWLKKRYGYNLIGSSIVILIIIEIILGIFNVVLRVQSLISAMHTAIAAALIGLLFLGISEAFIDREKT